MKTTTVAVIAISAASVCAQPIVVSRDYAGVPRAVADLEARKWHINWGKVGNIAKTAANIGASILFKRMDEDELYARGFINEEDLVARKFDDLKARGWGIDWGKVGNFAKGAAKVGASLLFKRMDEDELYARGFIYKDDLVTRNFDDDDYLVARNVKNGHPQPHPQPHPHPQSHPRPRPRPHPNPPHRGSSGNSPLGNVENFVKGAVKNVDWGQVAKGALKLGEDLLFKRMDEDELYARGLIDSEDLVTRDFDEDYLMTRDDDDDNGHRTPHRHGEGGKRRPSRLAGNLDDLD